MTGRPLISIVCPTYNRSAAIAATIESVLTQSVPDWELVVVGDGCTDDTLRQVASFGDSRIRTMQIAHTGHPSPARNAGLMAATAPIVAYLDHDDRWEPGHLTNLMVEFDSGATAVATGASYVDDTGHPIGTVEPLTLCWHPEIQLTAPLFEPSRVAIRAGLVEGVGGWRSGVGLEDWDLWNRLADHGVRFTTVLEPTVTMVQAAGSRTHRTPRRHRHPVATFDHPRRAATAAARIRQAPFRDAAREDLLDWYLRLDADGALVRPVGAAFDLRAEIDRSCSGANNGWSDLVVSPHSGRYQLSRMLWCADSAHAAALADVTERVHVRQWALARAIAADDGLAAA